MVTYLLVKKGGSKGGSTYS